MIEIPEAETISNQIQEKLSGLKITEAIAGHTPHKFAWFTGDPADYSGRLTGKSILCAEAAGGMIEVRLSGATLLFSDGASPRFFVTGSVVPQKHQLLLTFEDGSFLAGLIAMYGGFMCWEDDQPFYNPYYLAAKSKPSPLSESFSEAYFLDIMSDEEVRGLSLKAALATQQRIPGLGNGCLQDILWRAKLNPRLKVNTLSIDDLHHLFVVLIGTLEEMTQKGGRDTEKDLFGNPGGYHVRMAASTRDLPCPNCGAMIVKEAYLGGSVYYCPRCQPVMQP